VLRDVMIFRGTCMAIEWRYVTGMVWAVCVALVMLIDVSYAQSGSVFSGSVVAVHPGVAPVVVAPPRGVVDVPNSAGWNTGYSAVTSSYERPSRLGGILGVGDTVHETVTKVVPNDAWRRPIQGGFGAYGQPNSAGWSTGYSAVTSTYEKTGTFDNLLRGDDSITETTTRVVPNDALGQPITGMWP
jgi:hypothetical protein